MQTHLRLPYRHAIEARQTAAKAAAAQATAESNFESYANACFMGRRKKKKHRARPVSSV